MVGRRCNFGNFFVDSVKSIRGLTASLRRVTRGRGRTIYGSIGTNLSVRVCSTSSTHFMHPLMRLIERGGMSPQHVSSTIEEVLGVGFRLKLFRGHCMSPRRSDCNDGRGGTLTLRTTERTVILLGGSQRVLPLSEAGCGGVLIAKPGTSGRDVLNS